MQSSINDAVIDYHVLRRDASVATGFVFAGLHADGVVAYVKRAMADHYVFATLYIHAVAVLAVPRVADIEVAQDEVLAAHRVEVPCRAVLKRHALQEDAFAVHEMEQHGAEEGFNYLPEAVVGDHRHVLVHAISLREDRSAVRIPDVFLGHYADFLLQVFLPLARSHLAFLERTPPVAVAVERTMAGDGDILCAARIERRGATLGRNTLEPLVVDLIEVQIMAEDYETVRLGIETDVGFEGERAGGVDTCRNNHCSASGGCTFVDGFLDGLGSQRYARWIGSEIQHIECAARKRRYFHFRHLEGRRFGQPVDVALFGRLILRRRSASAQNGCYKQQ